MGELIRVKDWSETSCGAIEAWPSSMRTAVSTVLDARSPSIVLWGPELIQIYNDEYQPLLGGRHPHGLGQANQDCWPEVWHFNEPVYRRVMDFGEIVHYDDQEFVISASGAPESRYFTITYSPARDETGSVRGVIVVALETTDRILLERNNATLVEVAKSASRRQAFNLALSDALRCITAPEEVVAKASEMLGRELGVARVLYCEVHDANGTFEIRRDWTRDDIPSVAGHTRLLADFGNDLIDTLRAGKALAVSDVSSDERVAGVRIGYANLGVKSFVAFPLVKEGTLSVVLSVHQTEPYCWSAEDLALCVDFMERTWASAENAKAQAAFRAERDQSQAIFESMTEGFGLIGQDGTVIRMNQAGLQIAQKTAAQIIGHNHWEIWPETVGTELARLYAEVRRTGAASVYEFLHTFENGVTAWLESRVYRTSHDGLAVFFRDISERKQAEETLKEADRRKDEFLAMLAHELRNPLAPISAAASLLLLARHDEQRVTKASEVIARQVRHMSSLIDDLLDVSRVTRGLIELDKTTIDARHIVSDAVEQVRPLLEARHHRLVLSSSSESAFVVGDQKRLVQVLTNLLNNAVKFTPDSGEIVLTMEVQEECVFLTVADDGIGMAPVLLSRAFDLFAQAERTPDRSQGGLGLGLALVKSIVGLHGGTVVAKSAGLGLGSEFTVCLPRIAMPKLLRFEGYGLSQNSSEPLRILVVDDNVDAGNTLALLLTELGHSVVVAIDGMSALAHTTKEFFDVCLLDIGLPDMTGNELAQRIRAYSPMAEVTIIAVTGYGQKKDEIDSAAAGFDYHLVKPVNIERLLSLLAKVPRLTAA